MKRTIKLTATEYRTAALSLTSELNEAESTLTTNDAEGTARHFWGVSRSYGGQTLASVGRIIMKLRA